MPEIEHWSYMEILNVMGRSVQKIFMLQEKTEDFFRRLGEKLISLILTKDQVTQVYEKIEIIKEMLLKKGYKEDGDAHVVLNKIKEFFA